MWSHYADEHRGLCIEFDMTDSQCPNIQPVDYDRPTSIAMSDLIKWKLEKSSEAEARVRNTYFLAKSPEWKYEQEWRDIHRSNGVHPAPFTFSAVHFGLRCDKVVKDSIVKLLTDSNSSHLTFYEIFRIEGTSGLGRRAIDIDETIACAVSTSPLMDFREPPVILD
jgi:hypothetical protein